MSARVKDVLAPARDELLYEPFARRVRADDVVDSTQAILVWEPRRAVPSYAVPEADIRADVTAAPIIDTEVEGVLHPGIPFAVHTAPGEPVTIGGRPGAGFRIAGALDGYVVLDFHSFDAWYEEDERVYAHPRDPFHRVDVRRTSRAVVIEVDGEVLASTTSARLLFETNIHTRFYIPKQDVHFEPRPQRAAFLLPVQGRSPVLVGRRP